MCVCVCFHSVTTPHFLLQIELHHHSFPYFSQHLNVIQFFLGGVAESHHLELFSLFLFYRFITQVELWSSVKRFLSEGVINLHSFGVKFSSFSEKWFCCFWCINVVLETHCPPLCSPCFTSTALKIDTNKWFVGFLLKLNCTDLLCV